MDLFIWAVLLVLALEFIIYGSGISLAIIVIYTIFKKITKK